MKNVKNTKNKGFTLAELIGTIAVLLIVVSFIIYISVDSVNKAKENGYKITINNVERMASDYFAENSGTLFFVQDDVNNDSEYQCITIENLVDKGFFDNDITNSKVSKTRSVKLTDYVYLERSVNSKTLIKSKYIQNEDENIKCSKTIDLISDIYLLVNPNDWSKTKDLTFVYKLKNELNTQKYSYQYKYINEGESDKEFSNVDGLKKTISVNNKGNLFLRIVDANNQTIFEKNKEISMFDNQGPVVSMGNYSGSKYVLGSVTIPIVVNDIGSGVNGDSFKKDDITVMVDTTKIDNFTLTKVNDNNYKINITNYSVDGKIKINIDEGAILDKVLDKDKNTNDSTVIDTGITFANRFDLSISDYKTVAVENISDNVSDYIIKYDSGVHGKDHFVDEGKGITITNEKKFVISKSGVYTVAVMNSSKTGAIIKKIYVHDFAGTNKKSRTETITISDFSSLVGSAITYDSKATVSAKLDGKSLTISAKNGQYYEKKCDDGYEPNNNGKCIHTVKVDGYCYCDQYLYEVNCSNFSAAWIEKGYAYDIWKDKSCSTVGEKINYHGIFTKDMGDMKEYYRYTVGVLVK